MKMLCVREEYSDVDEIKLNCKAYNLPYITYVSLEELDTLALSKKMANSIKMQAHINKIT